MRKCYLLPLFFLLLCISCDNKQEKPIQSELSPFFSVPTLISKGDNISISLTNGASFSDSTSTKIFKFEPALKGKWVKTDPYTFVFSPESHLRSGEKYLLTVKNKGISGLPDTPSEIKLAISVIEQDYEVSLNALRTGGTNPPSMLLSGTINTADIADLNEVKKMLRIDQGAEVNWQSESQSSFSFQINKLERKEKGYDILLSFDGESIGVERQIEKIVSIPSLSDFSILSTRVSSSDPIYISLNFSDDIKENQDLTGLFQLEEDANARVTVQGNEVRIFPTKKFTGTKNLTINPGLVNTFGYRLETTIRRTLSFENPDPEIRLVGNGSILPSTKGLYFPFEAIGLNAVHVHIVKIHETNVPQFFQVNNYNGSDQTIRVGKPVFEGQVSLIENDLNASPGDWNRYHLDLSRFFEAEKGAVYQVTLSMRPDDAAFPCGDVAAYKPGESNKEKDWSIYEDDGFSSYGSYRDYYYPPGYQWSERDNPCHVSYFNYNRSVSTSLLASDIGLIAKIGSDNQVNIYTTSLASAQPIPADIEILDYQLQTLSRGKANSDGFFRVTPDNRPFLAIAMLDGQKSYLKLDDASSLSTSNFDVSGSRISKGLKGFIYGERGVWRPGNDIYLTFMLEDQNNQIPDDYPVKFELRDPSGKLKDEQVANQGLNKVYSFKTKTEGEDKTGNWLANVSIGNQTFSKQLKVETIKPNRLKINLEFSRDAFYISDGKISFLLSANWLTGLSAGALDAQVELNGFTSNTTFKGYPNYVFDMSFRDFYMDQRMIFDGQLNQDGSTQVNFSPSSIDEAPGKLRLRFDTKVFEPGGNFSIYSQSVDYYPYASFVGIKAPEPGEYGMLDRQKNHEFQIATVSDKGTGLSKNVKVDIYRMGWRWWWDQQDDYEASYITRSEERPVISKRVNTTNGKGSLEINGRDMEWGRHMMVVTDIQSGHQAADIFYMGWSEGEKGGLGASFLSVTTSKDSYEVGDKIEVKLPSSVEGRALITIENGSSVLDQFWINTQPGNTDFSFEATESMTPNIYLSVTLIQPHANTENDLPIRLYGILPLTVENQGSRLNPEIRMANELSPGKKVDIRISEEKGQPMTYTLAVVDEGLLDITGFQTPDPWSYFNQKEALGVKTWDVYDEVLGAYGGRLERLLAIGGGAELESTEPKQRDDRFKPVVQFMGPFQLQPGKSATHSFTMPQYIGSVKTMVVARSGEKYGNADQTTPVIQPLMILGTLPRVLGPGETIDLPVNLQRFDPSITRASVKVATEGIYSIKGATSQNVNLTSDTETTYFQLEVEEKTGSGTIQLQAEGSGNQAAHEISIASRNPNPPQTEVFVKQLSKGETLNYEVELFGIEGTNSASFTISTLPALNLEKRLKYLIRFPHGCIEQTTSSVFPQLFLGDLMDLNVSKKVEIEQNIKAGINRISTFQTYDGGFAYWPGSGDANHWGTNYATHFLVEAQKKGYYVPGEMIGDALTFLKNNARGWMKSDSRYNDDMIQAYRLYILALAGKADLSSMNRMRNLSDLSVQAIDRLAAAYAATGRENVATDLMQKSQNMDRKKTYDYWYTYGSEERDLSMLIETYVEMGKYELAFENIRTLASSLSSDEWLSTQTTAYALLAVGKFVARQESSEKISIEYTYGSESQSVDANAKMISLDLNVKGTKGDKLILTNNSGGSVFVTVTRSGTPMPGKEIASEKDLSISVSYFDDSGSPVRPDQLSIGTNITARVNVRNTTPSTIREIALTHIVPSGYEIKNERLLGENTPGQVEYQDIRDDRVLSYFDLRPNQSISVEVKMTASYGGKFYLPSITAEAMYDASKYAKTEGKWIEVTK